MYAVLFDIDGTLVQTGGAGQLAFAETFAQEFGVPQISKTVGFAGRSDRAIALDLFRAHGLPTTEEAWQQFRAGYLKRLPQALERRNGHVLPGVGELLAALKDLPHALVGLLTGNVREGAMRKLAYYGLDGHFAFGGFGDESTDRNEIAAIALAEAQRQATHQLGRPAPLTGVMVLGDTIHDIRCARSIVAVAIAIPTGGTPREELAAERPDILLDDLSDATAILRILREAQAA